MNATAITFPSWTAEVQVYSQKVIRHSPIILKAFNKTFAPAILDSLKGVGLHLIERERLWYQWTMNVAGITHNPLQSAVRAAHAELTSSEAQTTYRHIQHITRETAMDALAIGLCGVVVMAQGVEAAQKVYRTVKRCYEWVDARVNPEPLQPSILPSVDLFFAQDKAQEDIAAIMDEVGHDHSFLKQLDRLDASALAIVCSKVEDAIAQTNQAKTQQLKSDRITETKAVESPVASYGQIWNPAPTDIHAEVQQRLRAIAATEDSPASALNVPGAKVSTGKTGAKAKHRQSKGEAEAGTTRHGRTRV
jgi:hypothetical protein